MQPFAVVEDAFDVESYPCVSADHGLGVGVNRGVHAEMRRPFEELGAEGAFTHHRQAQIVPIEPLGASDVADEDRDGMERGCHAGTVAPPPGLAPPWSYPRLAQAAFQFRRIRSSPGRASGVSPNRR